jgi:protein SHQ1
MYFCNLWFNFSLLVFTSRLNLPKPIHEDGQEKALYNADSGELQQAIFNLKFSFGIKFVGHFVVHVAKVKSGEHFEGLDLLTKLLAPSGQTSASGPLIQVLGRLEKLALDSVLTHLMKLFRW